MTEPALPPPRQDNASPASGPPLTADFIMGMRFFSRLSMGDAPHEAPRLSRLAPAVPFVSLAIGLLPALLMMGLAWMTVPPYFAAAMGVAAMVLMTGAMPEDALADAADGLFGGATIEGRLEIMTDSRHGTYGVVAIGLYLLLRVTAFGALATANPLAAGAIMLAASLAGRSGSLWLPLTLPPAREGGAAASVGRPSRGAFWIGAAFGIVLMLVLAGPFVGLLGVGLALVATASVCAAWVWTCRTMVGGQTGDMIGALHGLIEVAVLTVFLVFA